jgi:hypothetical protein
MVKSDAAPLSFNLINIVVEIQIRFSQWPVSTYVP